MLLWPSYNFYQISNWKLWKSRLSVFITLKLIQRLLYQMPSILKTFRCTIDNFRWVTSCILQQVTCSSPNRFMKTDWLMAKGAHNKIFICKITLKFSSVRYCEMCHYINASDISKWTLIKPRVELKIRSRIFPRTTDEWDALQR